MTDKKRNHRQSLIDKLIDMLMQQPWSTIVIDLWKMVQELVQGHFPQGPYEVLEYESTLELLDPDGKHAIFRKREKIRYLQNNIIAYQDQAWGDGQILVNYRCTPGKPVDRYRTGHKWHMLVSRREVRNRGDIDVFNIEWEICNGFLKSTGYWETHVMHPTEHLEINVIFPESRQPQHITLVESNHKSRHVCAVGLETLLPDGRCLCRWESPYPRLHENYILQWEW
jgi:hypothetical protein